MTSARVVARAAMVAAVVVLGVHGSAALAEVKYTVTDLGPGWANAINNSGQVVGVSGLTTGGCAALWSGGTMTDLGAGSGSCAFGINDSGQVVGTTSASHAFLFGNGVMTDLSTQTGTPFGCAYGMNNSGKVVGSFGPPLGEGHAFLYSEGVMTDLFPGAGSCAYGINNFGQVVGWTASWGAFLYSDGVLSGLAPGTYNCAYSINDAGQIVGQFGLYSNGVITPLGTTAYGINNSGEVVGCTVTTSGSAAFLYSNGVLTDLNDLINPASGWTLEAAAAINDKGQIAGYGRNILSGQTDALLLTPTPEPATLALLAVGAAALVARRREKK